jgi:diguanylate cyclase
MCARYAGDEFVALVRDCPDRRTGEALAERLREAVNGRYSVGAHEVRLSASVGAALAERGDDAGDVIRAADLALTAAKARDRGAAVVADLDLLEPYRLRHRLEADLPRAIERGDFHLLYQPIASLSPGAAVRRYEALLRWEHPLHGSVPATLTVDLAEEARVIGRIDRWALGETCRQVASWRRVGIGASVSLNVSPSGLLGPGFADAVFEALALHRLDSSSLVIEVTEHALIEDLEAATAVLNRLRAHGISIYVDDFGTGFSSFTYLERLPLDGVKLDRTLIERLAHERRARAMTAGVIQVAHSLDLTVVAEGVESAEQRRVLAEIGCDYVQGYLIGRPATPDQADGG